PEPNHELGRLRQGEWLSEHHFALPLRDSPSKQPRTANFHLHPIFDQAELDCCRRTATELATRKAPFTGSSQCDDGEGVIVLLIFLFLFLSLGYRQARDQERRKSDSRQSPFRFHHPPLVLVPLKAIGYRSRGRVCNRLTLQLHSTILSLH